MKRSFLLVLIVLTAGAVAPAQTFKQKQLRYPRVRAAFVEKEALVRALFRERKLPFPPRGLFLRVFKKEAKLEVWATDSLGKYRLLKSYDICSSSGELGPKRQRGDCQVPEGFYRINDFNPYSTFHLSLGVSYPNKSDLILKTGRDPGGAIYIHGACVTIGCIPIEDEGIKELYLLAVEATAAGQREIPVHIFPSRLDSTGFEGLRAAHASDSSLVAFWRDLAEGYRIFEARGRLPRVTIDRRGRYICR